MAIIVWFLQKICAQKFWMRAFLERKFPDTQYTVYTLYALRLKECEPTCLHIIYVQNLFVNCYIYIYICNQHGGRCHISSGMLAYLAITCMTAAMYIVKIDFMHLWVI